MADEWLYVCTNGGGTKYPYGDQYDATKCVTPMADPREGVLAHPECTGVTSPFSEVSGLGTASHTTPSEFAGVVETTGKDGLPRRVLRGLGDGESPSSCYSVGTVRPAGVLGNAGFRCCGD